MVIDFHTHAFPDNLAKGTVDKLQNLASIQAQSDGTYHGLRESMKEAGIHASVVLPVLMKPSQFETVNQFAVSTLGMKGIIPFGSVHPESEDYKRELDWIKEKGLKGIKLHPVYQGVHIDDKGYVDLIRYALKLGLWVVIHAGIDIGYPYHVNSLPATIERMLERLVCKGVENRIILAHTGGFDCWDGVEALFVGKDLYFDISYTMGFIREKQFLNIVERHGVERFVFGTDSPWASQKEALRLFEALPLSREEKDCILYKNAARMLELDLDVL